MAIQTGEGPIRIDSDDAQFTFRGKSVAVKIRQIIWPVILLCVKNNAGVWEIDSDLTGDLLGSDVPGYTDPVDYWVKYHQGGTGFVKAIVLPNLNAALARIFPASGTALPPLEQIQMGLMGIKFTVNADGSVTAST